MAEEGLCNTYTLPIFCLGNTYFKHTEFEVQPGTTCKVILMYENKCKTWITYLSYFYRPDDIFLNTQELNLQFWIGTCVT